MDNETKQELGAGVVGAAVGGGAGAVVETGVGIATLGTATAGVVPLAIGGALVVGQGAATVAPPQGDRVCCVVGSRCGVRRCGISYGQRDEGRGRLSSPPRTACCTMP